jgi:hypothetical protein
MYNCDFCNKEFKTVSSFNFHQKTAKYCLKKQGKENNDYECKSCNKIFSRKQRLETHNEICKSKLNDKNEITRQNLVQDKIIEEKESKIKELENIIKEKDKLVEEKEFKNKELKDKLYKILEKDVDKNNYN